MDLSALLGRDESGLLDSAEHLGGGSSSNVSSRMRAGSVPLTICQATR